MAQSPGYLNRNASNWYIHGQIQEGYTNENQILGAGSGLGNNLQTIEASWNKRWTKYGIKFQHIAQDPLKLVNNNFKDLYLGTIDWHDYSYGLVINQRVKNILLKANLEWVKSKNYSWKEGRSATNLYIFLNIIYLWQ